MLTINGVSVVVPKKFQVDIADIDGEAYRNAKGQIIRDRIATKRKLICQWPPLTAAQSATLLGTMTAEYFTITYPDPLTGTNRTSTFYVGDRTIPMYRNLDGVVLWEGLSCDFIEK